MFLGNPRLPWHEDRHARLFAREAFSLSILLAIEDSPPDNCTVFVPGSHTLTPAAKEDRYGIAATRQAGGNVRYAGGIAAEFREPLSLEAGEMILFHPGLLHASSGFVNGRDLPSRERMSITLRVTTVECGNCARRGVFGGARGKGHGTAHRPSASANDRVVRETASPKPLSGRLAQVVA